MGRDVRVLAVDDQALFRRTCARLVAATPGFAWVGGVASGREALRWLDAAAPDLMLVDVRMPGMDGLETTARLVERRPGLVVVLVSIGPADALPAALLESGAAAHVRKHALTPSLLTRLWAAHGRRPVRA